jgi:hypothetical protein
MVVIELKIEKAVWCYWRLVVKSRETNRKQRLAFCTSDDIAKDIERKTDRRIMIALMAIIAVMAITN